MFARFSLLLLLSAPLGLAAEAAAPRVVNIVNFIRGVEPRRPMDLVEPVRQQLALARQHALTRCFGRRS